MSSIRPTTFLTENERKCLEAIVNQPAISRGAIAKKLGIGRPSVSYVSNQLEKRNLIRTWPTKKLATGYSKRELRLTFIGCVCYLAELEKLKRRDRNVVVDLAEHYGKQLSYPAFTEFSKIDEALRGQGTETFCSAARLLLSYPPDSGWNSVTFKQQPAMRLFIEQKRKEKTLWMDEQKEETETLKKEQEKTWMSNFAMILLRYIRPMHPLWSPKLNVYYKEIIQKQIADSLRELEQEKKLLSNIALRFRPSEKPKGYRESRVVREVGDGHH